MHPPAPSPIRQKGHSGRTAAAAPLAVAYREVRHAQPEDCLHVEALSVRGQPQGWTIPAHRHEGLHQFQWLSHGQVVCRLDGVEQRLAAPAAMLVAPGTVHGFDYSADAQGLQLTLPSLLLRQAPGQEPGLLARLGRSALFSSALLASDAIGPLAPVPLLLASLQDEYNQARPGRVMALQAGAWLLVLAFARAADPDAQPGASPPQRDTLVQRYRALVERGHLSGLSVADHAATLGVSSDHLSRCCRAVTGQPALALLQERRLLEARRLLVYSELPVADVAARLGFDDAGYFSRFFARASGTSPSVYRQQVRQGLLGQPGAAQV